MSDDADPHKTDEIDALFEEAAAWFLKLQAGDVLESDPDYRAWLAQSAAHDDAMKRARIAWGMVADKAGEPEFVTLRRDALTRSSAAAGSRWSSSRGASPKSGPWRWTAAAAACVAVVLAGALALQPWSRPDDAATTIMAETVDRYVTVIGETRTVTLADNSRISLDAATAVEVRYTDEARDIALLDGQAHFEVARDPNRPFRVSAGSKTVIATGTAFNVELVDDDVRVTLLEGEVIVTETGGDAGVTKDVTSGDREDGTRPVTTLSPGQQLIASSAAPAVITEAVDLERTNAWRRGKVMLEDDPLSVAVARMNRYSQIRLVVVDDSLDELAVSGVFNAGDTDAFLEALEALFPVDARRMSASRIEIHPRP